MRTFLGPRRSDHAANDAPSGFLRCMELWERAAQGQLLRIARINAGHEGAHKSFEKFSGEFSAHERGDRFILFRWPARAKQVAQDAPFRTRAEEGRSEDSWRRDRNLTQRSVNEHVAPRMPWCLDQMALNAQGDA